MHLAKKKNEQRQPMFAKNEPKHKIASPRRYNTTYCGMNKEELPVIVIGSFTISNYQLAPNLE